MKKLLLLLLLLLCVPMITLAQQTYVPDDNFEQHLIDMGYDNVLDNSVITSNISAVSGLSIVDKNISDLTGIEDFVNIVELNCAYNNLTTLDLSNIPNLYMFDCYGNQFVSLDIRNGNTANFLIMGFRNNPNLTCINMDQPWLINSMPAIVFSCDSQQYFSADCSNPASPVYWPNAQTSGLLDENIQEKKLSKSINILGREIKATRNEILFYIYNDGTVEKRIIIE